MKSEEIKQSIDSTLQTHHWFSLSKNIYVFNCTTVLLNWLCYLDQIMKLAIHIETLRQKLPSKSIIFDLQSANFVNSPFLEK